DIIIQTLLIVKPFLNYPESALMSVIPNRVRVRQVTGIPYSV
ncbi:11361_t:CDS:1, partial [Acaulospora morrowiae]